MGESQLVNWWMGESQLVNWRMGQGWQSPPPTTLGGSGTGALEAAATHPESAPCSPVCTRMHPVPCVARRSLPSGPQTFLVELLLRKISLEHQASLSWFLLDSIQANFVINKVFSLVLLYPEFYETHFFFLPLSLCGNWNWVWSLLQIDI